MRPMRMRSRHWSHDRAARPRPVPARGAGRGPARDRAPRPLHLRRVRRVHDGAQVVGDRRHVARFERADADLGVAEEPGRESAAVELGADVGTAAVRSSCCRSRTSTARTDPTTPTCRRSPTCSARPAPPCRRSTARDRRMPGASPSPGTRSPLPPAARTAKRMPPPARPSASGATGGPARSTPCSCPAPRRASARTSSRCSSSRR
jgi:hypothetical protein